jgi:glycosyltransferase involved in cell wall biosynthesis
MNNTTALADAPPVENFHAQIVENLPVIAILGTRGLPARYGGFETFAEELSSHLVARGYEVIVFGRKKFMEPEHVEDYKGIQLRQSSTVYHKYLETPIAALTSICKVNRRMCDAVILCNAANSPFAWILRLKGLSVFINVDGIERRRSKWNFLGRWWYRLGEFTSVLFATRVIADAETIGEYYQENYNLFPAIISYGARQRVEESSDVLQRFGLQSDRFVLYVSRLEPENNALGVIEAYRGIDTKIPLAIVGDAPYSDDYKRELRAAANENVKFLGYQFDSDYHALRSNCMMYIQATEVGGTHPALIEAMAYGNPIIANGTPENLEVLGGAGVYYRRNDFIDLRERILYFLNSKEERDSYGKLARERAGKLYSWDLITEKYERLWRRSTQQ